MQQDAISAFRKNLNDLEEIVMQAKRVPLSNMCMVDRERILGLANAITTDLPTVFAECEGVVQNQITIISEANERAETGVAGPAIPIAMSELNRPDNRELLGRNREKELIFYCHSGGRSGDVARQLAQEGFRTANMGSFAAWQAAGLPVRHE